MRFAVILRRTRIAGDGNLYGRTGDGNISVGDREGDGKVGIGIVELLRFKAHVRRARLRTLGGYDAIHCISILGRLEPDIPVHVVELAVRHGIIAGHNVLLPVIFLDAVIADDGNVDSQWLDGLIAVDNLKGDCEVAVFCNTELAGGKAHVCFTRCVGVHYHIFA